MTVTNTNNKVVLTGDGVTLIFAYTYRIFAASDLVVTISDTSVSPQVDTLLVLNSDYTVSGVGNPAGGNVTLVLTGQLSVAPSATDNITLLRIMPLIQNLDFIENDEFPSQSTEDALDKILFILQQLTEFDSRVFALDPNINGIDTTFPPPLANAVIGWNAAATALENKLLANSVLPTISAADDGKHIEVDSSGNFVVVVQDGTPNDSWFIGDGTDTNKRILAQNADVNKPELRYNASTNTWQFSNDGSVFFDIGTGGGASVIQSFVDGDLIGGILTVNHALNQQFVTVHIYDNNDTEIEVDDITVTDANNLDIDLTSFTPITGTFRAVILSTGTVSSSVATDLSLAGQVEGDLTVFNGGNWIVLPDVDVGFVLTSQGVGVIPAYAAIPLPTDFNLASEDEGDFPVFDGANWVVFPPGADGDVLTSNGAGVLPSYQTPSTLGMMVEIFSLSGTWTCPVGVNFICVSQCGAGAGGGGRNVSIGGGGGGGGASILKHVLQVTPLSTYAVTIGAKGIGKTGSSGPGTDGGNTIFVGDNTTLLAVGGDAGGSVSDPGVGGVGISSLDGQDGSAGGDGGLFESFSGGDGGQGDVGGAKLGGGGGASKLGEGGDRSATVGLPAKGPGGGGAGGEGDSLNNGGDGADGIVIIWYNPDGAPS